MTYKYFVKSLNRKCKWISNFFPFYIIYFKEIYAIVNFYVNLSTTSNASYFLNYSVSFGDT